MQLTPIIQISVSCNSGADLSGLIFGMRVSAGTKNPYHIYFPKTDAHGVTSIEATAVHGQFEDHWEEGLMDFNGTLETASQEVVFYLFDVETLQANLSMALAWPLLAYEKSVWTSRQEKVDYFLSCRNQQYNFDASAQTVPLTGRLRLEVSQ